MRHVVEEDVDDLASEPLAVVPSDDGVAVGHHELLALGHAQTLQVGQRQTRDERYPPLDPGEELLQAGQCGLPPLPCGTGHGSQGRRLVRQQEPWDDRDPRVQADTEGAQLPGLQGTAGLLQQLHGVHGRPGLSLGAVPVAAEVLELLEGLVVEEAVDAVLQATPGGQALVEGPRVLHSRAQDVGPHDGAALPRHDLDADLWEERLAPRVLRQVVEVYENGLGPEAPVVVPVEQLPRGVAHHVEPLQVVYVDARQVGQAVLYAPHHGGLRGPQHARVGRSVCRRLVDQVLGLVVRLVHAAADHGRHPVLLGKLQEVVDLLVRDEVRNECDPRFFVDHIGLEHARQAALVELRRAVLGGNDLWVDRADCELLEPDRSRSASLPVVKCHRGCPQQGGGLAGRSREP
mmetsp:Transcript_5606/g.17633  ORF Transcript_5606/g.17633 Transcript_5606/m.17633 type:complete len:404 (+) Transcript_5606:246-1457(+)